MSSTATSPLRAGVIGAGVFGGYHAGKYVENPDTTLTAIFDPDKERAQALADTHGVTAYSEVGLFLEAVDIVTIASPGVTHAQMGARVLEAGKPVLIEKPLAVTAQEADHLVRLASEQNLPLACGHQERLVFDVMGLTGIDTPPKRITAWREGPWSGRSTDISVTFDLMVHDLDLALTLITQPEARTLSVEGKSERSDSLDEVRMSARFANGAELELKASRIADERRRGMVVEYEDGVIEIDFVARTFKNTTGYDLNPDYADTPEGRDPLGANVARFVDAVLGRASAPAAPGEAGAAAVRFAERIDAMAAD